MDTTKLTDEFLATLIEAARTIGWSADYVEVMCFVNEVFALAGKETPATSDLLPYETDTLAVERLDHL